MKSSKVTRLSEKLIALQLLLFSLNYTKQCIYNFQVFYMSIISYKKYNLILMNHDAMT